MKISLISMLVVIPGVFLGPVAYGDTGVRVVYNGDVNHCICMYNAIEKVGTGISITKHNIFQNYQQIGAGTTQKFIFSLQTIDNCGSVRRPICTEGHVIGSISYKVNQDATTARILSATTSPGFFIDPPFKNETNNIVITYAPVIHSLPH